MSLQSILALTDLSGASRAGLRLADCLAARTGGRVDVGYVSSPLPGQREPEEKALIERAEALLEREEAVALRETVEACIGTARRGQTFRQRSDCVRCGIRDLVERQRPDLVCLAVRGHAAARLLVGSIAEYVARAAGVPVLLARDHGLPPPTEPLRALLAVDLLEPPAQAVARTRWLLGEQDELILAHVVETHVFFPPALGVQAALSPGQVADLKAKVTAQLRATDAGADAPRLEVQVAEGHPGEALVALAEQTTPHLVIARSHAARPYDPAILGPVCEYLVRKCPTSLLVLPKAAD